MPDTQTMTAPAQPVLEHHAPHPMHNGATHGHATHNHGRDKVHWSHEVWERVDRAVHDEVMRTRIGAKFLPIRPVLPRTTSVPTDSVSLPPPGGNQTLTVDEGATTRLNEYWVEFALTPQQVEHETGNVSELGHSTAVTLATRAANMLAQAEDLVIFQGANALANPLFQNIRMRGQLTDTGLLDLPPGWNSPNGTLLPPEQIIAVPQKNPRSPASCTGKTPSTRSPKVIRSSSRRANTVRTRWYSRRLRTRTVMRRCRTP